MVDVIIVSRETDVDPANWPMLVYNREISPAGLKFPKR
jgi:hypothetical protein